MAPLRSSRSSRSQTLAENNATTTNRTRTGQIDHDVFEGLPVRRWSRQPFSFSQTPKDDDDGDGSHSRGPKDLPDLPMPKDSHLLTPMSREMLRAARAGCRYIRPTPKFVDDDEKDPGDMDDPVEVVTQERSFTARKWTAIPRHIEPPEVEYLAKRRPGLPSLYGATTANADPSDPTGGAAAPQLRKTKIKKVDATSGSATIYEVWIPEGHTLEGEVQDSGEPGTETSEGIMIVPTPAPGTVVEGVGVVNAEGNLVVGVDSNAGLMPIKRRPPPPKRKGRGFGNRGRKKKVAFTHSDSADRAAAAGAAEGSTPTAGDVKPSSLETGENLGPSRMSIDSATATPDNRQDEDEEDEESDEGEEGEEVDEGDEIMEDTKSPGTALTPNAPPAPSETEAAANPKSEPQPENTISEQTAHAPPSRDLSSSPDLPLAAESAHRKLSMDRSPTKPTHPQLHEPPAQEPSAENPPPSISPPVPAPADTDMHTDTHLPPPPAEQEQEPEVKPETESPTKAQIPSPPAPQEEPSAEEPNTNPDPDAMEGVEHHPSQPAQEQPAPTAPTGVASLPPRPPAPVPEQAAEPEAAPQQSSEPPPPTSTITPPDPEPESKKSASEPAAPVHFDDGEVDLLGSLEASLGGDEEKKADVGGEATASTAVEEKKEGDGGEGGELKDGESKE
ncbi:hypothetical protein FQN54_004434 [Arachnomyces sp. PD_36]|nr:hypothetical protein FQN54_004434 [Arachnomyces sp. PD_36]